MNTPSPCNRCRHLYYNVMCEDDPDYTAECVAKDTRRTKWGDESCPIFELEQAKEAVHMSVLTHLETQYSHYVKELMKAQKEKDKNWEHISFLQGLTMAYSHAISLVKD